MCFGQAIVIFLQNTCFEAFGKKTSVIEVTSTEFLRIKELCLRQVSIRSVCLEKRLTLSWCLLYIFSAKARLYGHIFYHKCCARVSRSGLLLPSVKSKLLIVKYRAIENVLVTRYDGMRKCGCSKFEDWNIWR